MMNTLSADTPKYVLLDGEQRIGPKLLAAHSGPEYMADYGFSDKRRYDAFCASSHTALRPYPLVKRYLHRQLALPEDSVRLVVVDATGPNATHLNAATMSSVLEAQERQSSAVPVAFQLTLDRESQVYRVAKAVPDLGPADCQLEGTQISRNIAELESTKT